MCSQKKRYIKIPDFTIYYIYFKFIASFLYASPSRFFFWGLLNQQECIHSTNYMMSNFSVLTSFLARICGALWRGWNRLSLIHSFSNCDCILLTMQWFCIFLLLFWRRSIHVKYAYKHRSHALRQPGTCSQSQREKASITFV